MAKTKPLKIIPTCGPLPWPIIIWLPSLTSFAIFWDDIFINSFCSSGVLSNELPLKQ
ncbi:hypothetical protein [Mycoplasmopsis cricetuli]|uniref:hypothetical protein n=1 Tax=Mycoplasmopsis cricetuli TaxID=171283 RepID=UPI001FDF70DA|nr:hypothetical protein [Mycoplasmopsis cricetuli]